MTRTATRLRAPLLAALAALAGLFAAEVVAQPVITDATIEALIGQEFETHSFELDGDLQADADLRAAVQAIADVEGNDVTFDFSALPFREVATGTYHYRTSLEGLPGADRFPDAEFALVIDLDGTTTEASDSTAWLFATLTEEGMFNHGLVFVSQEDIDGDGQAPDTLVIDFEPSLQSLALPLTMGTTWSSTSTYSIVFSGFQFNPEIELQAEVDAYGTLLLPGQSVEALRVDQTLSTTVNIAGFEQTTTIRMLQFMAADQLTTATITLDENGEVLSASYSTNEGGATPPTAVDGPDELPDGIGLSQNYPNPFNPSTEITFELENASHVSLRVFDSLGREIAVLVDGVRPAGAHQATFDAAGLPSGAYLYRLETPSGALARTMLLSK